MADKVDPSLVQKFINVTGASENKARALLNACNGNLEVAIGIYLEEGNENAESYRCQVENLNDEVLIPEDDNVRAPIPQTRGVLLEGPYRASRPRRRGNQSVFDAFRDFQAEARQQEMETSGRKDKSKRKTLQDLFKPPLDIIHKGSFDTAKVAGEQENKWLMINIQDSKEFNCQRLNRDVWSNEAVRSIIREQFILWQVYHDSDDGDKYIQFYHVTKFPHLAILDPRTGEKMVEWDGVDPQSFCENATDFLSHNTLANNTAACSIPPSKRRKKDSIIDASEDSQLEAAIAASLQETSENCQGKGEDEDGESLTEFTDSESESEDVNKTLTKESKDTKITNDNNVNDNKNGVEHKKGQGSDNKNKTNENSNGCEQNNETNQDNKCLESDEDNLDPDCVKSFLMIRFPNGRRKQKLFSADATILDLVKYVGTQGFSNERYELITNFPRRQLSHMNSDISLKDAGLFPRETVFIQER